MISQRHTVLDTTFLHHHNVGHSDIFHNEYFICLIFHYNIASLLKSYVNVCMLTALLSLFAARFYASRILNAPPDNI